MVDRPYEGEWYALSLDFCQAHLETILSNAPPDVAEFLRQELSRDPASPRTIDFEGEVRFAVRARLGPLQRSQTEAFVPLVCQEILSGEKKNPTREFPSDPIVVIVSRIDVERRCTADTLNSLRGWVEGSSDPHEVRGRLRLVFDGYDADSRELWTIPEVREFVRLLDEAFPYWLYVIDLDSDCLKVIAFCLCRVSSPYPGATATHPEDLAEFLERHFGAMNQLLEHWSVSNDENERISNEIVRYFERAKILN
jgi:hypothetical protein